MKRLFLILILVFSIAGCSGGKTGGSTATKEQDEFYSFVWDSLMLCLVDEGYITPEESSYLERTENIHESEENVSCNGNSRAGCYYSGSETIVILSQQAWTERFGGEEAEEIGRIIYLATLIHELKHDFGKKYAGDINPVFNELPELEPGEEHEAGHFDQTFWRQDCNSANDLNLE